MSSPSTSSSISTTLLTLFQMTVDSSANHISSVKFLHPITLIPIKPKTNPRHLHTISLVLPSQCCPPGISIMLHNLPHASMDLQQWQVIHWGGGGHCCPLPCPCPHCYNPLPPCEQLLTAVVVVPSPSHHSMFPPCEQLLAAVVRDAVILGYLVKIYKNEYTS